VLRRTAPATSAPAGGQERLRFAGYCFDLGARRLYRDDGAEIELSAGDYDLLTMFVHHPHRVLTREQIMEYTRRRSWEVYDRSIDIAASRLRRKIEADPAHPVLIKTVRNGGYLFTAGIEHLA
ncbi:MAG: winged helix-turn-helix domain-containing protein, partial [Solimonas sp.]